MIQRLNISNVPLSAVKLNLTNASTIVVGDKEHASHPIYTPQQEIEAIRSKSGVPQVDVDHNSAAKSSTLGVLLLFVALAFSSS